MVKILWQEPVGLTDIQARVQTAIDLEFATLPPYLYAKFSILPEGNAIAARLLDSIVGEEMIHMCFACNILNAIGGTVAINPPNYPGPLPGDVDGELTVHLLPFSPAAMAQGMEIEHPSQAIDPPGLEPEATGVEVTIGQFYKHLERSLKHLPPQAWTAGRNQIADAQFFAGKLFPVNNYDDACCAIDEIISEGEGTPVSPETSGSPLDFEENLAHYYRFWELHLNKQLVKDANPVGYAWNGSLGVDWDACFPAIADPKLHDFSLDSLAARAAQTACNAAYTEMVNSLTEAFRGSAAGGLGIAVRAMFDLRTAALAALNTPLADGTSVAGPAFVYQGGTT